MKTIPKLFSVALTAILLSASFSACSDGSGVVIEPESPDIVSDSGTGKYEVTINLGTNITSDVGPITRADENVGNLYAVLVQTTDTIYESWGSYTQSYQYAYGVFDEAHKNNIRVILDADSIYNFYAMKIVDAENQIYSGTITRNNTTFEGYGAPYYEPYSDLNKFVYKDNIIDGNTILNSSFAIKPDGEVVYRAPLDRYYGQYEGYVPTEDNSIRIQMIRVSAGLQLNVTNLSEGDTLTVTSIYPNPVLTKDNPTYEGIFTYTIVNGLQELWRKWMNETVEDFALSGNYPCTLKWVGADGVEKPITVNVHSFSAPLKLQKKTIANITLTEPDNVDEAVSLTFTEQDITEGETYSVSPDGMFITSNND